jgi:hypothetical protein
VADYDSTADTKRHVAEVQRLLRQVIVDLERRSQVHDVSKLQPPEKQVFDIWTPKLRSMEYGSPEYRQALDAMGDALAHHYGANDHHPEHHARGVEDMTLVQLMEMLADWKAATLRHASGDMLDSLEQNAARFNIRPPLQRVLIRTAADLGWLE